MLVAPWRAPLRWLPIPSGLVLAVLAHFALMESGIHLMLVVQSGHAEGEVIATDQFAFFPARLPSRPGVAVAVVRTEGQTLSVGCQPDGGLAAYTAGQATVSFIRLDGCEVKTFLNQWIA